MRVLLAVALATFSFVIRPPALGASDGFPAGNNSTIPDTALSTIYNESWYAGAVPVPCRCRAGAVPVPCRSRAGPVPVPLLQILQTLIQGEFYVPLRRCTSHTVARSVTILGSRSVFCYLV
jgi:hypothetical protein